MAQATREGHHKRSSRNGSQSDAEPMAGAAGHDSMPSTDHFARQLLGH